MISITKIGIEPRPGISNEQVLEVSPKLTQDPTYRPQKPEFGNQSMIQYFRAELEFSLHRD